MENQNKNKQNEKKRTNVFTFWLKQMFLGDNVASKELDVMFEEQVQSPFKTIMENFFANRTAMFGLYAIITIMLLCFILPIFFPMNKFYNDSTQQDIPPGFNLMSLPKGLSNNALQIDGGSSFGVGLDQNGKLYQWGKPVKKMVDTFPKEGKYTMVSAGKDHALALKEDGSLISWGNDRHKLNQIPRELTQGDPIKQIFAGDQFSLVLKEDGNLYFWGNSSLITMNQNAIGRKIQGRIQSFQASSDNVIVLLDDGTLQVLGIKGTPVHRVPEGLENNVQALAMTKDAALALTKEGKLVVWGQDRNNLLSIPEEAAAGNITQIAAGRNHFVAINDQSQVFAWGSNYLGQINVPENLKTGKVAIDQLSSDYYQNYVISPDGKVQTFGLKGYLMGTDGFGRDMFKRLIVGGRLTLTVGASAVIIAMIIGVIVGGFAGFYGGRVDNILMRFAEIMGSIPFLPFAMTLSAVLGNNVTETQRIMIIMAILGILSWPGLARLVRGQILAEREKEFVTAAKAVGIRERAIIFKHILPNVISVVIVNVTLRYATSLLTESSLSFLGFGIVEPSPTWGNMMTSAQTSDVIANKWWRWAFPAIALSLSTISINLLGDGLGDAIDPKSHER